MEYEELSDKIIDFMKKRGYFDEFLDWYDLCECKECGIQEISQKRIDGVYDREPENCYEDEYIDYCENCGGAL